MTTHYDVAADVEFLNNPRLWPHWPLCPVKRQGPDGREVACVMEIGLMRQRFILIHANLWADKLNAPSEPVVSAQALVDAGWRVD